MERSEITARLKTLIERETKATITGGDAELDIDSFTMMLIIAYVGEEMRVELDMESLDFDAFTSLNTLADLVLKTEGKSAGAG